jgi:hypothetical protein
VRFHCKLDAASRVSAGSEILCCWRCCVKPCLATKKVNSVATSVLVPFL